MADRRFVKIGFDISQTGDGKAGCGYFAGSLAQSLIAGDRENEYVLYPYFGSRFVGDDTKETLAVTGRANVSRVATGRNVEEARAFWERFPSSGEETLGRPDIVHANNFYCPRAIRKARVIYTLYDMSFAIHPEFTTEANRYICFEGVFDASCYADAIVAISEYSRKTFREMFPHYPAERIHVVHLGSRFSSTPGGERGSAVEGLSSGGFWLSVGTLEPRKNVRRLLRAYAALVGRGQKSLPLVLAGGRGWLEEGLDDFIQALGIRKHVRVLGYVSDDTLNWLYRNCFAFVYPSHFEGFGLPVLEALSLGAAVISSNTTSLPEVGGDAVCYVDPLSEDDIALAMSRLLNDSGYRAGLKDLAKPQADRFSWDRCASEVLEIYREVLALPKLWHHPQPEPTPATAGRYARTGERVQSAGGTIEAP